MPTDPTCLAERCFAQQNTEDELFATIHRLLEGEDTRNCLREGFVFPCTTTSFDSCDTSVEVEMDVQVPRMTREQADAILALGFDLCYETYGEEGRCWHAKGVHPCNPNHGETEAEMRLLRAPGLLSLRRRWPR